MTKKSENRPQADPPKNKVRPMGDVLLDLEQLMLEMAVSHDLQWGDILNLVRGYLEVHCPGAREEYTEGGHPQFYYGPSLGKLEIKK